MATHTMTYDDDARILIEVTPAHIAGGAGEQQAHEQAAAALIQGAADSAIDTAFEVIQGMAMQAAQVVADLQQETSQPMPASFAVEFGVSFTGDLQAYIAKASATATFTVKLSWSLHNAA